MGIARGIMDIVTREMEKAGARRLKKVVVRVGEITAVEPAALVFCFEACIEGTGMRGATLEVEESALKGMCPSCGDTFEMKGFPASCPACGSAPIEMVSGDELDLVSIETS
jgi:hydrogenase nickel incorporation protein HypA/HybF